MEMANFQSAKALAVNVGPGISGAINPATFEYRCGSLLDPDPVCVVMDVAVRVSSPAAVVDEKAGLFPVINLAFLELRVGSVAHVHRGENVRMEVTVLNRSLTFGINPETDVLAVVNAAPAQNGIAFGRDHNSGEVVPMNVTILQGPLGATLESNAMPLAVVDFALGKDWVG